MTTPAVSAVTTWHPPTISSVPGRQSRPPLRSSGNRSIPSDVDPKQLAPELVRPTKCQATKCKDPASCLVGPRAKVKKEKLLRKQQEQEAEARKRPGGLVSKVTDGVQPEGRQPLSTLRARSAAPIEDERLRPVPSAPPFPPYIHRLQPWLACHGVPPSLKRFQRPNRLQNNFLHGSTLPPNLAEDSGRWTRFRLAG